MALFDTIQRGSHLNHFSKDVDVIDHDLPEKLDDFLTCALNTIFSFIIICFSTPWFMLVAVPLITFYVVVQVSSSPIIEYLTSFVALMWLQSPLIMHDNFKIVCCSNILFAVSNILIACVPIPSHLMVFFCAPKFLILFDVFCDGLVFKAVLS